MSINAVLLGKRLRDARINCGLTQEDAAEKIGMTRTALVQVEAGNRSIGASELFGLAELYHIDLTLLSSEGEIEDDPLIALCRVDQRLYDNIVVQQEISRYMEIFHEGIVLEQLFEDRVRSLPPAYSFSDPKNYAEAVKQGQELAVQERKRLNLGFSSISNVAELVIGQGIWASATQLPDELSGLFLYHSKIGMVILINIDHARVRRRFSYAHEYAHALMDRKHSATVTSRHNANELIEKRANAFASEFLMPTGGVEEALARLNKGGHSRQSFWLYDVANDDASYGEKRVLASSQKILSQDVALVAYEFQVSYQAAAYKLSDMRFVSRQELSILLENKKDGQAFLAALQLRDPEKEFNQDDEQPNLIGQIGRLAIEAYRRELIDKGRLFSICEKLNIPGAMFLKFADH